MALMRLKGLMNFVQYKCQDESMEEGEIREDSITPPNTMPSSPILSSSPGLFSSRLRVNNEMEEDEEDGYFSSFSPRSCSTPSKSSSSSVRSIDRSLHSLHLDCEIIESNGPSTTSIRASKRKGLAIVDVNSAPVSKRFRFEQHCFDYENIDRKQKKRLRKFQRETRLIDINEELTKAHMRLVVLESTRKLSFEELYSNVKEVKMRRRLLGSIKQVLQRKLAKSKAKKSSRSHSGAF